MSIVAIVGSSRLYLGAHWLTDVNRSEGRARQAGRGQNPNRPG